MKKCYSHKILLRQIVCIITVCIFFISCSSHKSVKHRQHSGRQPQHVEVLIPKGTSKTREAICNEAVKWIGSPYCYAGQDRETGTDCSGMVMAIYKDVAKVMLPRNSAKQAEFCRQLKHSQVKPGDLVFFATGKDPKRVSHVGIMINNEDFIHASTSKGVVLSKITTPYYQRTFIMFGGVLK